MGARFEVRGARVVLPRVDALPDLPFQRGFLAREPLLQGVEEGEVLLADRRLDLLAHLELLQQEIGRHLGIGLEGNVDPVQLEEVLRALYRVLQRAIGLVHPGSPLQRRAPLGLAGVHEAVGMHARLDLAVGLLQGLPVQAERRSQPEKLEVALQPARR